ncbi:DNA polymerase III subunit gamma and tau, partial [Herbiconiux sp. CPCC 203406]|nr:DNA polymerase III subunit gamma and tau [Herbiconiux oxytropis]
FRHAPAAPAAPQSRTAPSAPSPAAAPSTGNPSPSTGNPSAGSAPTGGRQAGAVPATSSGGPTAQVSAARPGGDPAARPGALRFEGAGEEPSAPGAAPAPAPTVGGRARYGEAVVREILGANFIEEQPLPGREG